MTEPSFRTIIPGCIYRHFKGNYYKVHHVARHTETGELLVVYEALYDDHKMWVRPLKMFLEDVPDPKNPEKMVHRFTATEVFPDA